MKRPVHMSVKITCLFIAAISVTAVAYEEVFSKSSTTVSDDETLRVFSTFIGNTPAEQNSTIIVKSAQSEAGLQPTRNGQKETADIEGVAPLSVVFESKNSPGNVSSYDWSFGDGDIASGASVSHTFKYQGTYLVTLKTREKTGSLRLDNVKITVSGPSPQ